MQDMLFALQVAGMEEVRRYPGNPFDVQVQRFGQATAYAACAVPEGGWWNRVVGFTGETVPLLDEIMAFFRPFRRSFYLDMGPTVLTEELARLLVERGLCPAPNGTFLYGLPRTDALHRLSERVVVQETRDVEQCLDLWVDGFAFPPGEMKDTFKALRKGSFMLPESHLYIASLDGTPAAMAMLCIKDGLGHLSTGATLPAWRNQGCHHALIARRIADAALAGCELITGDTGSIGSKSQNHMEQVGLQIAFTRWTWVSHQR
jgi:hypothetical protein